MNQYIATFYTHFGALATSNTLKEKNVLCTLMPAPRKLSSSCGTCLSYEAEEPLISLMDSDYEAVYLVSDSEYILLQSNEE